MVAEQLKVALKNTIQVGGRGIALLWHNRSAKIHLKLHRHGAIEHKKTPQ